MTRRGWAFDLGLAVLLGAATAGVVAAFPGSVVAPLLATTVPQALGWIALSSVVLAFRRQAPVAVSVALSLITIALPAGYAAFAGLYAAGAYARPRWVLWVLAPLTVACSFVGQRGWIGFRFNDHAFVLFVAVLLTLAGLYVGTRREAVAAATERAERAEREQELLAEQARAQERVRLAAEMHDVVTHRVNLMVLQAGALGVTSDDPAVRAAAEELRGAGVTALAELRDLVGVLRAGRTAGSVDGPVPAGELDALVADSRGVGVATTLRVDGDPDVAAPTVRRTLHRVVQEALTNARKHARGAAVEVSVRYADPVSVVVLNGPGEGPADTSGGGAGLDGLRERVTLVGGTFAAGPTEDGGFRVAAHLPAYVPTRESADA